MAARRTTPHSIRSPLPVSDSIVRDVERVGTFLISATAAFALTMNIAFVESFPNAQLGLVLAFLVLVHLSVCPKIRFHREQVAYGLFIAYMAIQLCWTEDIRLAMNTLVPAANSFLVLALFGSLVAYYNLHAVLIGILGGVLAGACIYTLASGFPFSRPSAFSYNAIAGIHLFGLFVALLLIPFGRAKSVLQTVALVFLLLIVATTSIKTNLGVMLGALATGIMYLRQFLAVLGKNIVVLVALSALLGVLVISNEALMQSLQSGYNRVLLGMEILEARENLPGYSALEKRNHWINDGLAGWRENPIFGHGVEAFRDRYGITSHSTAIDLLYNSGLIGFLLFYFVFVSVLWRAVAHHARAYQFSALIFGTTICYLSMSLSGIMHYSSFMAAFLAIGAALLSQIRRMPLVLYSRVRTTTDSGDKRS